MSETFAIFIFTILAMLGLHIDANPNSAFSKQVRGLSVAVGKFLYWLLRVILFIAGYYLIASEFPSDEPVTRAAVLKISWGFIVLLYAISLVPSIREQNALRRQVEQLSSEIDNLKKKSIDKPKH